MKKMVGFKNYAGILGIDNDLIEELELAGIEYYKLPIPCSGEVSTRIIGEITGSGWRFSRAWTYWVAEGPGIPPYDAEKLHKKYGKVVRVAGHCGSPSPIEWYGGFGCGSYHVDTLGGLKALADTIKEIMARNKR